MFKFLYIFFLHFLSFCLSVRIANCIKCLFVCVCSAGLLRPCWVATSTPGAVLSACLPRLSSSTSSQRLLASPGCTTFRYSRWCCNLQTIGANFSTKLFFLNYHKHVRSLNSLISNIILHSIIRNSSIPSVFKHEWSFTITYIFMFKGTGTIQFFINWTHACLRTNWLNYFFVLIKNSNSFRFEIQTSWGLTRQ